MTVHRGQSPVESPPFFEALAGGEDDEGEDEQTDADRIDEAVDAATDADVAVDVPAGATETVDIDLSETAFARYESRRSGRPTRVPTKSRSGAPPGTSAVGPN